MVAGQSLWVRAYRPRAITINTSIANRNIQPRSWEKICYLEDRSDDDEVKWLLWRRWQERVRPDTNTWRCIWQHCQDHPHSTLCTVYNYTIIQCTI